MSLPTCAALNHCIMKELPLPPSGGMRHFCLHCGHQKHAPCGLEYASLLENKKENKDILDVIAPKNKDDKGNEMDDRPDPKPAGEKQGMALEICYHCVHEIRSSSTPAAAPPPAVPPASTEPMMIDITNETEGTAATDTTNSVHAEAMKKPNWLRVRAANKNIVSNIKKGKKPLHKRNSNSRAGKKSYYVEEKLNMVLIYENATNGTGCKGGLARKWNVNEKTVRTWVRMKVDLEEQVKMGKGAKRTVLSDPLQRISIGLMQFYEANQRMIRDLKLPMTGNY